MKNYWYHDMQSIVVKIWMLLKKERNDKLTTGKKSSVSLCLGYAYSQRNSR